jgi:hypothetical protein
LSRPNWFSVDGTQVAAWASMKSFRAKDGSDESPLRLCSRLDGTSSADVRGIVTRVRKEGPPKSLARRRNGSRKLCLGPGSGRPRVGAVPHADRSEHGGLRRLQRESPASPFVFVSERGSPFTTAGFARVIERDAAGAYRATLYRIQAAERIAVIVA